jgi:transcriptional regulator with XRE-family HTH domain
MKTEDSEFFIKLGKRLASFRKQAGFTQQSLADVMGMEQSVIASYEIARRRMPMSQVKRFSEVLNVSILDLIEERETKSKPGPTPKLNRQLSQISELPRSEQQLVSKLLERFITPVS